MKKHKLLIMVFVLLFLGIGFASVSTTLMIDAGAELSKNNEDFDVRFTKVKFEGNDISSTAISNDGKSISFGTNELLNSGDSSVVTYKVTNNSTMYDATISINCVSNDEHGNLYTVSTSIANQVEGKKKVSGTTTVTLNSTQQSAIQGALTCTLTATPVERTTVAEDSPNSNIVKVMRYSEETSNKCITGDEATCEELTVTGSSTYSTGTIVKYKVNSSTTRTFFVMHDDGDELTLQDRENLLNATPWYSESTDNSHGPTTALTALESATSSWNNVEAQTYTMGTTEFGWGTHKNAYTGCSETGCDRNSNYGYTLEARTGKSRMITMQEALDLGCTTSVQSCPIWMNNYLKNATSYGGTNTGKDYVYWTMSAKSSYSYSAWAVRYDGYVNYGNTTDTYIGVRPVVVVKK